MWWQDREALRAYTADFVDGQLRRLGLGPASRSGTVAGDAGQALSDPAACGLASLPFLEMAGRFSEALGLDRTGLADLLLVHRSLDGWVETAARSLAIDDRAIRFHSSGSTGEPARSQHTLTALQRETAFFAAELAPVRRVVALVPAHHIYGFLWTLLLPRALQCPVERLSPARLLPATLARRISEDDVVVGTPALWRLLLEHRQQLPARFTAISSTAPLPLEVGAMLRRELPDTRLIEVYGSTATAAIGWRQTPGEDWSLLPWWRFHCPEAKMSSRDVEQLIDQDDHTTHEPDDRITCQSERRFRLHGRRDAVIQIAGHNINLAEVRRRLIEHPDVFDAAVRPDRDSLRLFLALHAPPGQPEVWCQHFQQWLGNALPDIPAASSILLGEHLPRNAMGKLADWRESDHPVIAGRFRRARPELLDTPGAIQ